MGHFLIQTKSINIQSSFSDCIFMLLKNNCWLILLCVVFFCFFYMSQLVRWWRALECTTTGAAVGSDWGVRGVLSSRCCSEGTRKSSGSLQVRGGRSHQQSHSKDRRKRSLWVLFHFFAVIFLKKKNVFSLVYLGFLLERWLLGIQVLSLHGEAELLYRRDWSSDSK